MGTFSVTERVWGGVGAGFAVGVLSTALVWAASGPETVTETLEVPGPTITRTQTVTSSQTLTETSVVVNWMEELRPQVDPAGLGEWRFEVHPETGAWGTTDGHTVWIDPQVPQDYRYSVMVHEYAHILQRNHYGSLDEASKQTDFESLADCMALEMGATHTSYGCDEDLIPVATTILGG